MQTHISLGAVCDESCTHGFEAEAEPGMVRRPYLRFDALLVDGFESHTIVLDR